MNLLKQIRKDKALFAALGVMVLCILFAGCVPSLHPLFSADTIIFKEELLGTWKEKPDAKEGWKFEKGDEEKVYKLTLTEDEGKISPFQARLVKLGETLFLDLFPEGDAMDQTKFGTWYRISLIPGHLILKVGKIGETLELSVVEPDWLKEQIKQNPKSIDHAFLDQDNFVLTAKTPELQAFFKKHANTKEAWGDPGVFKKE